MCVSHNPTSVSPRGFCWHIHAKSQGTSDQMRGQPGSDLGTEKLIQLVQVCKLPSFFPCTDVNCLYLWLSEWVLTKTWFKIYFSMQNALFLTARVKVLRLTLTVWKNHREDNGYHHACVLLCFKPPTTAENKGDWTLFEDSHPEALHKLPICPCNEGLLERYRKYMGMGVPLSMNYSSNRTMKFKTWNIYLRLVGPTSFHLTSKPIIVPLQLVL